jgi:hypothetical protein
MANPTTVVVGRRPPGPPFDSNVEWVALEGRDVVRLVARIKDGGVKAVVLALPGLGHGLSVPIISACRQRNVPYVLCKRSSRTQVKSAINTGTSGSGKAKPHHGQPNPRTQSPRRVPTQH